MTNENVDSGNDNNNNENTSSGTSSTSTTKAAKQGTIVDVLGGTSGKQVISEVLGSSSTGGTKVSFGDYKFIGSIQGFLEKHATRSSNGSSLRVKTVNGPDRSISNWVVIDSEAYNMFKSEKFIFVNSNTPMEKMVFGPLSAFEYIPEILIEYEGIDPSYFNSNVLVLANNTEAISINNCDIFEEGTVDITPGTMGTQVHE